MPILVIFHFTISKEEFYIATVHFFISTLCNQKYSWGVFFFHLFYVAFLLITHTSYILPRCFAASLCLNALIELFSYLPPLHSKSWKVKLFELLWNCPWHSPLEYIWLQGSTWISTGGLRADLCCCFFFLNPFNVHICSNRLWWALLRAPSETQLAEGRVYEVSQGQCTINLQKVTPSFLV